MQRIIALLGTLGLVAGLSLMACGEDTARREQDKTQAIADSIAQADSLAMLQDSIEAMEMMQKEGQALPDSF